MSFGVLCMSTTGGSTNKLMKKSLTAVQNLLLEDQPRSRRGPASPYPH